MKKNEYLAPEMEIVEITEQYNIMGASGESPEGGIYDKDVDPDDM